MPNQSVERMRRSDRLRPMLVGCRQVISLQPFSGSRRRIAHLFRSAASGRSGFSPCPCVSVVIFTTEAQSVLSIGYGGATDFFSRSSRGSRLQFGDSWPEIFEDMNTSPNQPLEATGVSARDWPWSFGFAPSVLAGASADR